LATALGELAVGEALAIGAASTHRGAGRPARRWPTALGELAGPSAPTFDHRGQLDHRGAGHRQRPWPRAALGELAVGELVALGEALTAGAAWANAASSITAGWPSARSWPWPFGQLGPRRGSARARRPSAAWLPTALGELALGEALTASAWTTAALRPVRRTLAAAG
jgi:hypothetical protein